MDGLGDIDLLRREMDLLWGADLYGRSQRPQPLVAVATANDGHAVRFGPALPPHLRRAWEGDGLVAAEGNGVPPPALARWCEELTRRGPARLHGGPSFVFTREAVLHSTSPLRIVTSEDAAASGLTESRPEPWGDAEEWIDLLAGRLGPWAFGMAGERVVSICYTPVASATAAEAGVWTHPEARGRGGAAVATRAWARVAAKRFEILFYSTGFYNIASQAVARKLGVRPIGTIWQILEDTR